MASPSAELNALLSTDAASLRVFERKVLHKILGPVRVSGDFQIRFNGELYELLNDMDVVQYINIQRLRGLGHVVRMEEDVQARQVFDEAICGSQRRGKPCMEENAPARRIFDAGIYGSRRRGRHCIH